MTGHSRVFHLAVALGAPLALMLGIRTLPSATAASDLGVALRELVLIGGAVGLLWLLLQRFGDSAGALGAQRFTMGTLGWGLLCFLAAVIVSGLMIYGSSALGGGSQSSAVIAQLASRPVWLILLIALGAAVSEEIVFRSVMIRHLEAATGSAWVAGAVSLAAFSFAHLASWGPWQVLFVSAPGLVLTLFFFWKRNLWVCIIAHFLADALGLLGAAASAGHG